MNIYEQLQGLKADLEDQGARAKSIHVIDRMITRVADQRDNAISVSRLQVLRHMMRTPEILNDEEIRIDFIALEGDLEDAAALRSQSAPASQEPDRAPKLKKYYKKK